MKINKKIFTYHFAAYLIMLTSSQVIAQSTELTRSDKITAPANTFYGNRGLSQTSSAEALGMGRLIFALHGTWYQQQNSFTRAPNKNAHIFTGISAISVGVNPYVDIYGSLTNYTSVNYNSSNATDIGTIGAGIQATLPFAPSTPIRMAGQFGVYQGNSKNAINKNNADGYNYFETRTGLDFITRLIQTIKIGNEDNAFKLHFNEGIASSVEKGTYDQILLASGLQYSCPSMVAGLEVNSRTRLNHVSILTDPFWITPSIQYRTPYYVDFTLGTDISLSQDRVNTTVRALEPYRIFAGLSFSFDTDARRRKLASNNARDKKDLINENNQLNENAYLDSLQLIDQKRISDSLATVASKKAQQDSLALIATQKKLDEEKLNRSNLERQLLAKGQLFLDTVYFETGKTDVSLNSKPYLNNIAQTLSKYPKLKMEVAGQTDNIGSAGYNDTLSQERAESVMKYLISVKPELKNQLNAKGYGEHHPKASNDSEEGREINRRTELRVLNKDVIKEYNP